MPVSAFFVRARLRWWFKPLMHTMAAFCKLTGWQPSDDTLTRICRHAVVVTGPYAEKEA